MSDIFIIENFVNDIHENITSLSRLMYEINASLTFIDNCINDIKANHMDNSYRKYILNILEKSKLAMFNFNLRTIEKKKFTFIELYSFYEIIANILNAINIYTKSTQLTWKCMYRITDEEYIILEKI